MKICCYCYFSALIWLSIVLAASATQAKKLICYYDSKKHDAKGLARYALKDLETALQYCTHVIYGYAGLRSQTFQLSSINEKLDIKRAHFANVTALKAKHPHIKFLLSLGGDHDLLKPQKYVELLEANRLKKLYFIETARTLLQTYNFDGLDLAFQLPRNKPRKVHTELGMRWKQFKKWFTGDFTVDKRATEHRQQFTELVFDLKKAFEMHNLMLSLTVLPNVNSSWYYDVPAIIEKLDFVNLAAFDFLTPARNPEEADFTAPLYEPHGQNRLAHYNVDFQVKYWLQQGAPADKLNVGIATYGRAWKMSAESGNTGLPVVPATAGGFLAGSQTHTKGLLSWSEICQGLPHVLTHIISVDDPTKRHNKYAFGPPSPFSKYGIWISYDDPRTAAYKADYVKTKNLGGVALFDLTMDDFRGQCEPGKYGMLRAIYNILFRVL